MSGMVLDMKNVRCGYGTRPVLNGVDLSVGAGETVLLAGPNGCGKSTMLKAILGMLPLDTGTIRFNGAPLEGMTTEKRVRAGIGYLRQTGNIFPGLTVEENLELAGLALSASDFDREKDRILGIFDFLKGVLKKRSGVLSGGQRQALAIAMVLLRPRSLYLLDEPTAGLSPAAAADIMERLRHFREANGEISILMVEHRLELLQWIDRAVILIQGKIQAETDDAKVLLDSQWLEKHYF